MARLTWQAGIAISLGEFMEPASILAFGYECTTAGTTGTEEPNWPLVAAGTVVDGTVTWTARTSMTITWTAVPLYKTGAVEPVWPTTIGDTVVDGSVTWTVETPAITDAKCPHSRLAIALASKIFSPYRDVTRYCATDNPRDWSSQDDAGFIPTGLHSPQSPEITAMGEFRGRMALWTASNLLIWNVDPDPALITLFDTIPGIGSVYPDAVISFAGDLGFMTKLGVRSVTVAAGAETLQAGDIGTPIDELVQAKLAGPDEPKGFYYPGSGQGWWAFGSEVYVYSRSKLGKPGSWSRYVFPYSMVESTQLGGELYLRAGDDLYRIDEAAQDDDGTEFEGIIEWPYLDMGSPGTTKMVDSIDVVGYGVCTVSLGYDQTNAAAVTTPVTIDPDTVPGGRIPIPVAGASLSMKLVYAGGQSWQLNAANFWITDFRMGM
jgi:hypothetical protein